MEFKCYDCDMVFEAEGIKVDYIDPLYGPCSKVVAKCRICGSDVSEYRKPKPAKVSKGPENTCPAYHNGTCSCCH